MADWLNKILIIAPHSDDETLSLGGTICKAKEMGGEVRVVVAVAGDIVFWHNGRVEVPASQRVKELDGAMECLGVDSWRVVFKERNLESRLDTIPIRDLIYEFDKEIEAYRPGALFFPRKSYHQDHIIVNQAAVAACRPNTDKFMCPRVIEYEYPGSMWNKSDEGDWANLFVGLPGEFLEKKIEAFQIHLSQQRKEDHIFSMDTVRLWAKMRGRAVGAEYAEACRCWRWVE